MIVHIVLFEPKPDLSAEHQRRFFSDLQASAGAIPSVRRFRIGRRLLHGLPGYEQAMRDSYSFAAVIEFEDRGGLEAYLAHPAHRKLGEHFATAALRALAYDYEMVDAAGADPAHVVPPD